MTTAFDAIVPQGFSIEASGRDSRIKICQKVSNTLQDNLSLCRNFQNCSARQPELTQSPLISEESAIQILEQNTNCYTPLKKRRGAVHSGGNSVEETVQD